MYDKRLDQYARLNCLATSRLADAAVTSLLVSVAVHQVGVLLDNPRLPCVALLLCLLNEHPVAGILVLVVLEVRVAQGLLGRRPLGGIPPQHISHKGNGLGRCVGNQGG